MDREVLSLDFPLQPTTDLTVQKCSEMLPNTEFSWFFDRYRVLRIHFIVFWTPKECIQRTGSRIWTLDTKVHLFWILTRYFFRLSRRHLEPVPTCSHTHGILVECCGGPSDSSWAARTIDYFFRRNESADVSLSRYRHPEIWDQKTPKIWKFIKNTKNIISDFVSVYF